MKTNGYTLIELITTLSIIAIISVIAIPALTQHHSKTYQNQYLHHLKQQLRLAQSYAERYQQPIVICSSQSKQYCDGTWNDGAISFIDLNQNRQIDPGENLLETLEPLAKPASLSLSAFPSRHSLKFLPNTLLSSSNGTFTYQATPTATAHQLIISNTGRIRTSHKN